MSKKIEMSRSEACYMAVKAISKIAVEPTLTKENAQEIAQVLRDNHINVGEFIHMDERPGMYFHDDWHWKLRQVRNSYYYLLDDVFQKTS